MRLKLLVLLIAGAGLAASVALASDRFNLPEGPGRDLVYGQCQTCHDLQSLVDSAGIGRGAWNAVLDNMRNFGLRITADQRARILDYLATYLGPNPPPAAPAASTEPEAVDAASVFLGICSACHQPDGKGKPGEFPNLAGNPDLFLAPKFPALVVLHGITGPIEVAGSSYNNTMPPFDFLSDDQIAAVIDYVRSKWGNDKLAPDASFHISAADVADARKTEMTAEQVHALRQSLLPH